MIVVIFFSKVINIKIAIGNGFFFFFFLKF